MSISFSFFFSFLMHLISCFSHSSSFFSCSFCIHCIKKLSVQQPEKVERENLSKGVIIRDFGTNNSLLIMFTRPCNNHISLCAHLMPHIPLHSNQVLYAFMSPLLLVALLCPKINFWRSNWVSVLTRMVLIDGWIQMLVQMVPNLIWGPVRL